ncbi:hypothetical protein [Paenibacillus sp.]|uniref:hypothetical protein n=1 Tax=Paenibacillus sp. TaxID=58172 RepID=UPI002D5F24EC|nr:hypothetical protein [Paenibacillus sp.]HZG86152.1 hypothetical protein [Paenibacillus sp.]
MFNKIMLWAFLIAPWPTLFFLSKETVKRYMPVAIFVSLLVTILFEAAHALKWWVMIDRIVPWGYITNVSFVYGVFLVGTIWIFHLTYRNFWLYMATNVVIDGVFAFVLHHFFEGRIYKLVNFNEFQVFLLMVGLALTIFLYQKWQEGIFKGGVQSANNDAFGMVLKKIFRRQKAK